MDIINEYDKIFKKLKTLNDDNEASHIFQDKIYRKFIRDINSDRFNSIKEIKYISSLMIKNVIKYDKNRWYA